MFSRLSSTRTTLPKGSEKRRWQPSNHLIFHCQYYNAMKWFLVVRVDRIGCKVIV